MKIITVVLIILALSGCDKVPVEPIEQDEFVDHSNNDNLLYFSCSRNSGTVESLFVVYKDSYYGSNGDHYFYKDDGNHRWLLDDDHISMRYVHESNPDNYGYGWTSQKYSSTSWSDLFVEFEASYFSSTEKTRLNRQTLKYQYESKEKYGYEWKDFSSCSLLDETEGLAERNRFRTNISEYESRKLDEKEAANEKAKSNRGF